MSSYYRQQLEGYLGQQSYKVGNVLDVGASDGLAKSRVKKLECNNYTTLDWDNKSDISHDLNIFSPAEELFSFNRERHFELIFCLEVFEYIWNPYNAIANLHNWLKPNGTLVVTFPTIYPLHNPEGIDYLRYSKEWIVKIMQGRFDFKQLDILPRVATNGRADLASFYKNEQMHARKGTEDIFDIGYIVKAKK